MNITEIVNKIIRISGISTSLIYKFHSEGANVKK